MALACGDVFRAGALGGGGWERLAQGDRLGALRVSRTGGEQRTPAMRFLEAEALIASGAIMAGLQRLERLHATADPASTVALARRRHALADHAGAERVASALPMHAVAALAGARAALANDRIDAAFRFIEPFLHGVAPIPDPTTAGAVALIAASALARNRQFERLENIAANLLDASDLPDDMMPAVARMAWMAGLGSAAWERFEGESEWMAAARLELSLVSGNAALVSRLVQRTGVLAAPSEPAVRLLHGDFAPDENSLKIFGEGVVVHIWRTHPHRWQPWIETALATPADVAVFDLGQGVVPDPETIPHVVLDDGSLVDVLIPEPVVVNVPDGSGLWIEPPLAGPTGVGHEWPEEEMEQLRMLAPLASRADRAAVRITGEEAALRWAPEGRPTVVIAPPGDPFWAGPLPERVWPAMRVIRTDPRHGWRGAAARAARAIHELTGVG